MLNGLVKRVYSTQNEMSNFGRQIETERTERNAKIITHRK
jgi:hypothetical protein